MRVRQPVLQPHLANLPPHPHGTGSLKPLPELKHGHTPSLKQNVYVLLQYTTHTCTWMFFKFLTTLTFHLHQFNTQACIQQWFFLSEIRLYSHKTNRFIFLFKSFLRPCSALAGHIHDIGTDRSLLTRHDALLLQQIARDFLHALSHRHDNAWHSLWWTSRLPWWEQVSDPQIASELSKQAEQRWGEPSTYWLLTHMRYRWANPAPKKHKTV